jgi:hypothetical protein
MARSSRRTVDRKRKGTLGRVAAAAAKQKGKIQWASWDDGDVLVLRVLDAGENFQDAYVHRVKMDKDGGKDHYFADVPCLDQDDKGIPCPGCADELPRRYKFWTNVIVRDWEDDSGEEKDTLMVWSGGITVAKRLDKLDARFGGLDKRDIEVEREGKGKNDTKYEVEPASDSNEPLSDDDKLLAKKSHDLARYTEPPSFDDFYVPPSERDRDDDDDDVGEQSKRRGSAFKRRSKSDDDDGDDGARRTSTRRRSSKSSKPQLKSFGGEKSSGTSSKKNNTVRRRRSR